MAAIRAQFVFEKFTDKTDPIRDMGIGSFPKNFVPMYIMIKSFPGAKYPIGTVFGKEENGQGGFQGYTLGALYKGKVYYDGYEEKIYFKPWVGKFFEKYE